MKSADLLNEHTCEIIEDLLPFYVEGYMEPAASSFVKKHLEHCPKCHGLWKMMREDFPEPDKCHTNFPAFPIRHKYRQRLVLCSVCAAIAAMGIFALLL